MPSSALVAVSVNGIAIDPAIVLADVTIRSGRTRADDGIEPASCTIELLQADPGGAMAMIGDDLQVTVNGAPRFTGRICEIDSASSPEDPQASTFTIVGIGPLARLARVLVAMPLAAGNAAARAQQIFDLCGLPCQIDGGDTVQLADYGQAGDPPAGADQVMSAIASDTGAIIADQGSGVILAQFLDSRLGHDTFTPDPRDTHVDLDWEMTDDLVNHAEVAWSGGTVTTEDPASIARFDRHAVSLNTGLGDISSATRRSNSIVARLAQPAWRLGDVQTWDAGILGHSVGALVTIGPLPPSSPVSDPWTGVLEGWIDTYQPSVDGAIIGSWDLAVGDLLHSAETLTWAGVDPATLQWAQVAPAVRWQDAISNGDLQ